MEAWCSSTMGGQLGGEASGGQRPVGLEVEIQGRVEEDGDEAGPLGGLLGLGAPTIVLALEAEAGDDADHGPAPVAQVEQGTGAADGLVVGVRARCGGPWGP